MGRAGGAGLRAALQQVVRAAIYLRRALAGAFGPPQPQQLFCVSSSCSLPLCTSSAPSAGLTGALVRSGVAELGRGCARWGGEALARSCAAHVVGSRTDCPHGCPGGGPCPVQGHALALAALRGMRGRGGARVGPAHGNQRRRTRHSIQFNRLIAGLNGDGQVMIRATLMRPGWRLLCGTSIARPS